MRTSVTVVHSLVSSLEPVDDIEADHLAQTLTWLERTDDVFRRVKPAEPPQHLVSYVVPVDPADGSLLLVDHVNAGLWLPPGGHVEVDEHPLRTAQRELTEELGLTAERLRPLFLTVTETVGIDAGHIDVSIWFVHAVHKEVELTPDRGEFHGARWWSRDELATARTGGRFDPHLFRFLAKLSGTRDTTAPAR
jgi:8-oxo-dGTP pyrophosphatase MutT (NUDIX family)